MEKHEGVQRVGALLYCMAQVQAYYVGASPSRGKGEGRGEGRGKGREAERGRDAQAHVHVHVTGKEGICA